MKSPYDAAWSSLERAESLLRTSKEFAKYLEKAIAELRAELREAEKDL